MGYLFLKFFLLICSKPSKYFWNGLFIFYIFNLFISREGVGFLKNQTISSIMQTWIIRCTLTTCYLGIVKKSNIEGMLERRDGDSVRHHRESFSVHPTSKGPEVEILLESIGVLRETEMQVDG